MIFLGVDPGATLGWALVDMFSGKPRLVRCGSIDTREQFNPLELPILESEAVCIETVVRAFPRAGMGTDMSTHLIRAADVGGEVSGASKALSRQVHRATANEWRGALCGMRAPSDADIKRSLLIQVDGIGRTNAHARDAIGVAVYCARRFALNGAKWASLTSR